MEIEITEDAIIFKGVEVAKIDWLETVSPSERDAAFFALKDAVENIPVEDW